MQHIAKIQAKRNRRAGRTDPLISQALDKHKHGIVDGQW